MFIVKILTTSMIGAALIIAGMISNQFKDNKAARGVVGYIALTYILSILCIWLG